LLEDGYKLDSAKGQSNAKKEAVLKHLRPEPQIRLGCALGVDGLVSAMIDVSDGLSTDLWHILDESGVGATITADSIPISDCVTAIGSDMGCDPPRLALNGGEEYELLFTAPVENESKITELSETLGVRISPIGEIVEQSGLRLIHANGEFEMLRPTGFEHLK
jgi:thiamine-monophosphate kinase